MRRHVEYVVELSHGLLVSLSADPTPSPVRCRGNRESRQTTVPQLTLLLLHLHLTDQMHVVCGMEHLVLVGPGKSDI